RSSGHEQRRIDRRLEQRQLLKDAFNVQTMADLEEPIGHRVPVTEQLVVFRAAEVEQLRQRQRRLRAWRRQLAPDLRRQIFNRHQRVRETIELWLERIVRFRADSGARRDYVRPRPEDLCRQNVELRGLVDGFNRVLREKQVTPSNQIV